MVSLGLSVKFSHVRLKRMRMFHTALLQPTVDAQNWPLLTAVWDLED